MGIDDVSLDTLELSVRAGHCLKTAGIRTIGQYIRLGNDQRNSIPRFGDRCREELAARISELMAPTVPATPQIAKKRTGGRPRIPEDQQRKQFGLRLAPVLRLRLEEAARVNQRSLMKEAEIRLSESFKVEEMASITDRLARLEKQISDWIVMQERQ